MLCSTDFSVRYGIVGHVVLDGSSTCGICRLAATTQGELRRRPLARCFVDVFRRKQAKEQESAITFVFKNFKVT